MTLLKRITHILSLYLVTCMETLPCYIFFPARAKDSNCFVTDNNNESHIPNKHNINVMCILSL